MYVVVHKEEYGELIIKSALTEEEVKKHIVEALLTIDEDDNEWPVEVLGLKGGLESGDFGPRSFLILDVNKVVQPEIKVHMEVTMNWDRGIECDN